MMHTISVHQFSMDMHVPRNLPARKGLPISLVY